MKIILFLLILTTSCVKTETQIRPLFIPIPETKEQLATLENDLVISAKMYQENGVKYFEKLEKSYKIDRDYLDLFFQIVKLKNRYILELEQRIDNNNLKANQPFK